MTQFTVTQLDIIRRHLAENRSVTDRCAGYFRRVADVDEDTALSIATVAMLLRMREKAVSQYIDFNDRQTA